MKNLFLIALSAMLFTGCKNETTPDSAAKDTENQSQQTEIADAKYTEVGKKALAALAKGDVDGWLADYADNAKYYWNSGDSLIGKPEIEKYWRDRRANALESVSFSNEIWLPIKVNQPQQKEKPGVWLMGWFVCTAKYKGGSTMTQWMHMLYHFDENGKIDEVNHFLDRAPIMAAMPKK